MIENNIISNIYHLRKNFAIIGLTGRTGSGCTTIANLFSCEEKDSDLADSEKGKLVFGIVGNKNEKIYICSLSWTFCRNASVPF